MSDHHFTVEASWHGSLDGAGQLDTAGLGTSFSVPAALSGPGRGTNPEELLVAASASCYLITLRVTLTQRSLSCEMLGITSEGTFEFDRGLRLVKIEHRPWVTVPRGATASQRRAMVEAMLHAERRCMVSLAMSGNVEVHVLPQIDIMPSSSEEVASPTSSRFDAEAEAR